MERNEKYNWAEDESIAKRFKILRHDSFSPSNIDAEQQAAAW